MRENREKKGGATRNQLLELFKPETAESLFNIGKGRPEWSQRTLKFCSDL